MKRMFLDITTQNEGDALDDGIRGDEISIASTEGSTPSEHQYWVDACLRTGPIWKERLLSLIHI